MIGTFIICPVCRLFLFLLLSRSVRYLDAIYSISISLSDFFLWSIVHLRTLWSYITCCSMNFGTVDSIFRSWLHNISDCEMSLYLRIMATEMSYWLRFIFVSYRSDALTQLLLRRSITRQVAIQLNIDRAAFVRLIFYSHTYNGVHLECVDIATRQACLYSAPLCILFII